MAERDLNDLGGDEDEDRPRSRRRRDEEEDDDRPRRSRRDEDDDRPRRRPYRDQTEDDYSDDFGRRRNTDGMGQAAMWTGIGSLAVTLLSIGCTCVVPHLIFGVILGVLAGIVAIVLGFMARSRSIGSGYGLTGILTGFGSLLIGIALTILIVAVGVAFMNAMPPPPPNAPNAPVNNQPKKL